jgi:DNA-nicking Smr family endonuclease
MGKKKDKKRDAEKEPPLPKFGGFQSLAGSLEGFKKKLVDEQKEAEQKAAEKKLPPPRPKPAAPPPRRDTTPRDAADDDLTFHRMMSGVVPLDASHGRVGKTDDVLTTKSPKLKAEEVKARAAQEAEKALDHLHSLVDDAARFEVSDDGRRVEGRRVDAPPDLVRSLRRGMLPIDGRLDLHGLGADAAREKLAEFLRTMRTRGERCVLVIHGKGERVPGGGVLRGEIAAWLSQGKARESVLAFATARDDDGGEGAVYVALRR